MKSFSTLLIVSVFGIKSSEQASCTYGYLAENGPATWNAGCATGTSPSGFCDGKAQSPIDLPYNGVSIKRDWLPFQLIHYDIHPYKMYLENNGHTAKVSFEAASCTHIPTVIQGGLKDTYELAQFHFHWGNTGGEKGSEHTLYGKQFDAELHFVHYNTRCGRNLAEALKNCEGHDAAAVLGVFIDEGGSDNHAFDEIIDGLDNIIAESSGKQEIKTFDMTKLFPHDLDEFYRYDGSLTTPGCNEVVTWTVFKNYVKMSKRQLAKFFKLTTDSGKGSSTTAVPLVNNYRHTQPLNDRTIYYVDLKLRCKHRDWTSSKESACTIYYKETDDELGFMEAIHSCIGYHYGKTPFQGLIPVGRLRCLRNRYRETSGDDICGRFFRVNAVKDIRGVWREYPNGQRVEFHHFPEFNPLHGGAGDTLVWDAFLNRLFIEDEHEHYHAMCYRDYENDCEHCVGFENGRTCTNSGDCVNSMCMCDDHFSEMDCTLGPVPDKEIISVGGSTSAAKTSSTYTLPSYNQYTKGTSGTCNTVPSYSDATSTSDHQICEFVFGRGFCCNGLTAADTPTDLCKYYDCFTDTWKAASNTPAKLYQHAEVKVTHKGRDMFWMISGGRTDKDTRSDKIYTMNENMVWSDFGVTMPKMREYHCMVQINDCEIAFIGGFRGTYNSDSYLTIEILNYKEKTWRTGPNLANNVIPATCALITDQTDYCSYVVIGCGTTIDSTTNSIGNSNNKNVQMWNLETNEIKEMTDTKYACPSGHPTLAEDGKFKELDHSYLAYTNTHDDSSGELWYFTKQNGFQKADGNNLMVDTEDHHRGDSFVAPRGTSMDSTCFV